jgi:protein-tyrosine-phosphatase
MTFEDLRIARTPEFLKAISHELRWRLLLALVESDRRVQELVRLLGQPQNLVSYHLHRLQKQGVVSDRRSSADARAVYYSLNLDKVRQLYIQSGEMLHPALGSSTDVKVERTKGGFATRPRVLFLCTHNSARSQMAEGILRARGGGAVEVYSAGTQPTRIHPLSVRAMGDLKIDISQQRSKHMNEFILQKFDYIITVCDRAREACPIFPGDPTQIHWSIPDPAAVEGNEAERFKAFADTAVQLNTRIGYLLMIIRRNQEEK